MIWFVPPWLILLNLVVSVLRRLVRREDRSDG